MDNPTCAVEQCAKPRYQNKPMCGSHFMKWYRYGDPHYKAPRRHTDVTGRRFGQVVAIELRGDSWLCRCDCGTEFLRKYSNLNQIGDGNSCGIRSNHRNADASYQSAHEWVRRDRGPARDHPCVGCGKTAAHWSYDHTDPDQRYEPGLSAKPVAYSLDTSRYQPRCVRCHKRYDLELARRPAGFGTQLALI